MGTVAKRRIIGGKKVAFGGPAAGLAPRALTEFERRALGHFGFVRIAEKVAQQELLDVEDIHALLSSASIPVLLKLIEFKGRSEQSVQAQPVVVLPMRRLLAKYGQSEVLDRARTALAQLPYQEVRVIVKEIEYSALDGWFHDLIGQVAVSRPGLTLIGPSVDEILVWVLDHFGPLSQDARRDEIRAILGALKSAGIGKLQATARTAFLKEIKRAGFVGSLITRLDRFNTPERLAHEMFRIDRLSRARPLIDVWSPGIRSLRARSRFSGSSLDFRILRALAVGTILFDRIPLRRAYGRYLSLEALEFSRHCGANEFALGGVNDESCEMLQIHPISQLSRVMPMHNAGQ